MSFKNQTVRYEFKKISDMIAKILSEIEEFQNKAKKRTIYNSIFFNKAFSESKANFFF